MIRPALRFLVLTVALSLPSVVSAQDCACNSVTPTINHGSHSRTWGLRNCGRSVSQQKAAGLWAGYCSADCSITVGGCNACGAQDCSGGCRLGSKFHGLLHKPCGCDQGCDSGCGHTCKIKQRISGVGDKCNNHAGNCFGWPKQNNACQHNACPTVPDCGCKSSCKIRHLFNSCKFTRQGMFDCSKDRCGCSGAYFDECVGFEYGTAGMQSCVGRILDDSNSNDEAPGKPGV